MPGVIGVHLEGPFLSPARPGIHDRTAIRPIAEADVKRQVVAYPDLGWSVEHRRVETIDAAAAPAWMRGALVPASA